MKIFIDLSEGSRWHMKDNKKWLSYPKRKSERILFTTLRYSNHLLAGGYEIQSYRPYEVIIAVALKKLIRRLHNENTSRPERRS